MPTSVVQPSGTPLSVEHPPSSRSHAEPGAIDLSRLAQDLSIRKVLVENVVQMLDEGHTIPFISRYRRERIGGLNEEMLRLIHDRLRQSRQFGERKRSILRTIENQGKLTAELRSAILSAEHPRRLEDLYLPYKPKKRTPAAAARDKGLEPLAWAIWHGDPAVNNLAEILSAMVNPEKGLTEPDKVLEGVRHLLSEWIGESADVRAGLRHLLWDGGKIAVNKSERLAEGQGQEYKDYFSYNGPLRHLPPHRILSINRGEKENALTVKVEWDSEAALRIVLERLPLPLPGEPPPIAPSQAASELRPSPSDSQPLAPAGGSEPSPSESQPLADAHGSEGETQPFADAHGAEPEPRPLGSGNGTETPPPVEVPHPPTPMLAPSARITPMAQRAEALQNHPHADLVRSAAADALTHILTASLEREVRRELSYRAEDHAIAIFARNLESRLLTPPLIGRRVLAIDPTFRVGCRLAALDESGNLLDHAHVHPHSGGNRAEAKAKLEELVRRHQIPVIAIGNGPACRETEEIVSELIAELEARRRGEAPPPPTPVESAAPAESPTEAPPTTEPPAAAIEPAAPAPPPEPLPEAPPELAYVIVSEAGAGAYATSPIAREELPNIEPPLRGAISIGRRLQDPLRELVKIDPQHIGVGLFPHDVNPKQLRQALDGVVESCVNHVGVDLNTAGLPLLRRVSGFHPLLARDLIEHRKANGPFRNRRQLLQVKGFNEARFLQAAGFVQIDDGENPLDATWIHPESYPVAEQILSEIGYGPDVLRDPARLEELRSKLKTLAPEPLAARLHSDVPTVRLILAELANPGGDPRAELPPPVMKKAILKIENLQPGMELTGTVQNVVDFGAFIDIGLKDSGLVHISQMANRYVKSTYDVVAVGDVIPVWVLAVDMERRRVSLSMVRPGTPRKPMERRPEPRPRPAERGERPEGAREGRPPRRGRRPPPPRGGPASAQTAPATAGMARGPAPAGPRPPQPPRKPRRQPPKPKLSQSALAGATPLGTFAELAAFWEAKKKEEPQPVPPAPPSTGGEQPPA